MPRITLMLSRTEEDALIQLALADLRLPNVEARFLLRQELVRRGALKPSPSQTEDAGHQIESETALSRRTRIAGTE